MNLERLKPWNWFKHEEGGNDNGRRVPVSRTEAAGDSAAGSGSLMRLHDQMDRWFDEAFRSFGMPSPAGFDRANPVAEIFRPQIDISGDDDGYQISLDVPGLDEFDLSLELMDDVLMIKGRKEERSESRDRHYYRVERSYGSFQRTLTLPDDADVERIEASLNKGVLHLAIPRSAEKSNDVRRIPISV